MGLQLVTAPAAEPLQGVDYLEHVRELDTAQESYLTALGVAAREQLEDFTGRAFLPQTWKLTLDAFPCGDTIWLPRPPLISVTDLKYIGPDGVLTVWPSSNYDVDATVDPARLVLAYGITWPSTRAVANAVQITYQAGYTDAAQVPARLQHALKLLVGHWYEHREPVLTGTIQSQLPHGVEALCWPFRVSVF